MPYNRQTRNWYSLGCTNSTRVLAKNWSHSAAQERPSKPKRRLLDFDESDESIEEEDELDAELSLLLIDRLKLQFIIVCRYKKRPALDEGKDP